jgi:hypothetical protein
VEKDPDPSIAQRKRANHKETVRQDVRAKVRRSRRRLGGRRLRPLSAMTSARGSSSEATESNDKDIAAGMIKLAIACDHAQQQSAKDADGAGNLFSRSSSSGLGFSAAPSPLQCVLQVLGLRTCIRIELTSSQIPKERNASSRDASECNYPPLATFNVRFQGQCALSE